MSRRPRSKDDRKKVTAAGPWIWMAGVAGYLVFLFRDLLVGGKIFFFRDHLMVYLPRDASFRRAIAEGVLPLWEPLFHGGQPFAANPGRQVFYPPHYLVLIGDLAAGYALFIIFHMLMAALGMFVLVRFAGGGNAAAALGAVTLAMSGPYLSSVHLLPSLCAVTWMPWIARYTEGFLRTRRPLQFLGAVIPLALLALGGDPVQAPLSGALMIGWCVARQSFTDRAAAARTAFRDALWVLAIGGSALLLALVQLWPAVDFARDTVRTETMSFEMVSYWSFPPARALEFVFPAAFERLAPGYLYQARGGEAFLVSVHLGFVTCLLVLGALGARKAGAGALGVAITLLGMVAIGSHTPLLRLLYDLHLVPSLRYPEKLVLPAAFLLIFWSMLAFEDLRQGDRRIFRWVIGVGVVALAVAVVLALWRDPVATAAAVQSARSYWLRMLVVGAVSVALLAVVFRSKSEIAAVLLVAFVALVDLGGSARRWTPTMPGALLEPPLVAAGLDDDRDAYRIFNHAALEFLDDRSPESLAWFRSIQLLLHRNGMFPLSNGIWGYSSILEWDTEHTALMPYVEFQRAMYDARGGGVSRWKEIFASMGNARFRTEIRPLGGAPLSGNTNALTIRPVDLIRMDDAPRYRFATSLRRVDGRASFVEDLGSWTAGAAWVSGMEPFAPAAGSVLSVDETRHSVTLRVRAEGRAYLIISITPHRYWSATIDGERASLLVTNLGFQGIEVPAGEHAIELRYRNPVIVPAMAVSMLALVALVAGTLWLERLSKRSGQSADQSLPDT